jgi:hypothetical protein
VQAGREDMQSKQFHLSDQSLLLAADGELPNRRAAQVRAHLAACWDCRARMAEIETTIVDFVRASRHAIDPCLPPVSRSRARLKAQLNDLAQRSQSPRWPQMLFGANWRGLAVAFALILVLLVTERALYERISGESIDSMAAYSAPLPNPALTPGSVRTVTFSELCSMKHDEVVRRVPGSVRQQVLREYGMENVRAGDYEMDHLITPGLGGADDIRNLWPEPHYNTEWNSYVKDQLEEHLHQLVCNRQVSLATAQRDIASNWIRAYKKYFRTDSPLPSYAMSAVAGPATRFPGARVPTFRQVRDVGTGVLRQRPPAFILEATALLISVLLAGLALLRFGVHFVGFRSGCGAPCSERYLFTREISARSPTTYRQQAFHQSMLVCAEAPRQLSLRPLWSARIST